MDNNKQETTESTLITGLSPTQEQVAILLASGESVTDVANKMNINRTTIYLWQQKINFQCFYNQQCKIIQDNIRNGLCGLYKEALEAVKDCLKSPNEALRLKTAMYVISKVEILDTSKQNPVKEIEKLCTSDWTDGFDDKVLDKKQFNKLMEENGLL